MISKTNINRLTVIFFITLCLIVGVSLTLLPWAGAGSLTDWGNNFFLVSISQFVSLPVIRQFVASGWVRGAVTALGLLNLFIAFWEIAHFNQSLQYLEEKDS